MIIYDYYLHELVSQFVQNTESKLLPKRLNKWLIELWNIQNEQRCKYLAPIVSGRKGTHVKVLEELKKQGYVRVRVDGEMRDLDDDIESR